MQNVSEQQLAEAVEHALADEAQCVFCRKWKPRTLLRDTARTAFGRGPYCPVGLDRECDRISTGHDQ